MDNRINILEQTEEDLKKIVEDYGDRSFRAGQIYAWIWKKGVRDFSQMTNIPLALRQQLKEKCYFPFFQVRDQQKSADGTIKVLLEIEDHQLIESVLIPTPTRMTACISSQVGCSLTCKFCATGRMGLKRNLKFYEIVEQVRVLQDLAIKEYRKPLSNIVVMGMGEPLLNYNQLKKAIAIITSPETMEMSPRRITVSTAGIAKMIKKMADEQWRVNLALSLHAANDEKRNKIMPINEHNNLAVLHEALLYYTQKTKNKVTLEYLLLKNFNDSLKDAAELVKFCRKVPSKVNLIEYNPVTGNEFEKPTGETIDAFADYLENAGIVAKIRRSRGKDIEAACGQLSIKHREVNEV